MADAAREMDAAGQKEAGAEMGQAEKNTEKGQHGQARQDLDKAAQELAQARQQAEQDLAQAQQKLEAGQAMNSKPNPAAPPGPPGPPKPGQPGQEAPGQQSPKPGQPGQEASGQQPPQPGQTPSSPPKLGDKTEHNEAAGNDPLKVRYAESTWRAKLPERERQALLSARKEPYPPQMEAEVKKYYELLAE
jgi:hypothetical protein